MIFGFGQPCFVEGQSRPGPSSPRGYEFDTTFYNTGREITIRTREFGTEKLLLSGRHLNEVVFVDTIYRNGLLYIKFPDFDGDGNADILMDYIGNNSTYFLYLYDPINVRFRSIEGYMDFPDAVHLKADPSYYYSYHRAGCADANWVSDLFRIDQFKIIHLGHMNGNGCPGEEDTHPPMIEVYKMQGNDESETALVEKHPYEQCIPEMGDKREFIRRYWNKNVGRFR